MALALGGAAAGQHLRQGCAESGGYPPGSTPKLPKTWPGLPLLLDSPGYSPIFKGEMVEVKVPFDRAEAIAAASFDGVTAGLRVNASMHNPLLCVVNVFKVASGNLSLPGKVNQ